METPENILEKLVDPNKNTKSLKVARPSEASNRHKSKVPKNNHISNLIGNMNDSMVTRRQSRNNKISFFCYTSQLELKKVEEALTNES